MDSMFQLISSNSRDEPESKVNIPSTQSYSNAIQTLINSSNVRVKIADLGNACYDVSDWNIAIKLHFNKTNSFLFSIIILLKTFKRDNIGPLKYYLVLHITILLIFGALHVWHLNYPLVIICSIHMEETIIHVTKTI